MNIQSLSIVVPGNNCINNCKYCVARMNKDAFLYKNQMDDNLPFYDLYFNDYLKRLEYARDVGVQTVMLTGNCEPQQNRKFLKDFGIMMMLMSRPFRNIEMQTTGRLIDDNYLRFLRNHVGVNIISLSISSFYDKNNCLIIDNEYMNKHDNNSCDIFINLHDLCEKIKKYDFTLRVSLNMSKYIFNKEADSKYSCKSVPEIFKCCKEFNADQVTIRVLYSSNESNNQNKWIVKNGLKNTDIDIIRNYIEQNGKLITILPYGSSQYELDGMSVVLDNDCMSKIKKGDLKYLILRPDCKLYSQWDSKASLVF